MGLTVQGWQNLVLLVMGLVVVAGAVAGAYLQNRTDRLSRELIDDIQPARVAAYQLQAAVRDQETALRGYVLSGNRQFLDPYYEGQRTEQTSAKNIVEEVGGRAELVADLGAVEEATQHWRTSYAEPLIARVFPGVPYLPDAATAEVGKAEFDRIRVLFERQNQNLAEARMRGIDELESVRARRDGVLAALVGAFVLTALLLALVVRRALARPLAVLADACRRITEGDFTKQIIPQGPKDIRGIATDVENMRQRLVEELDATTSARKALAEQADELQRSNAELEQFAYVASHDLQEPLRKVASFCQLLEKRYGDKLDERGVEYIAFAVDGAKRMQVLINDLLTFSRVGRLSADQANVDLGVALRDAERNLAAAIEESGAQIIWPDEPLPSITGDPTLLVMLWQNLIGNAVKFRRDGVPPRIVIDCERRDDNWLFSVSDNGIGIPEEFVEKVFVIFQRLHARDAYSGTGIGLALCRKIVEHHGGTITVDTSYTEGTRLQFTIPRAEATQPAADQEGATV